LNFWFHKKLCVSSNIDTYIELIFVLYKSAKLLRKFCENEVLGIPQAGYTPPPEIATFAKVTNCDKLSKQAINHEHINGKGVN